MRAIRGEYQRLGREPTDIELETIAQTWSEHCVHKTLKSRVRYRELRGVEASRAGGPPGSESGGGAVVGRAGVDGTRERSAGRMGVEFTFGGPGTNGPTIRPPLVEAEGGDDGEPGSGGVFRIDWSGRPGHVVSEDGTVEIDNLLKRTVAAATFELIEEGVDWTLSVFKDNSGVIAFDDEYGVCVKVETHNRPSAIEPYGGAATGAGGCIRDVIGTGLGARPIASTDVFCVAHPDGWSPGGGKALPPGALPPRRILGEVVAGVRDYGNRMGIPTVSGAVHFDDRYVGNPLVFCGCIGLIPRGLVEGRVRPGDRIIAVGGRTGRDGIHGATFSSAEVKHTHADEFAHAVQIGNAIEEKRVLDAIIRARDEGPLYHAMTDCGAGGFSSAIGEMGREVGAQVHLDRAPLKYAGLTYTEIWISEAQERMVLAVAPENVEKLRAIGEREGVEIADLGEFGTPDGSLRLFFGGQRVGELSMSFLHEGLPSVVREATWTPRESGHWGAGREESPARAAGVGDRLLGLLGHPTIASKHWIIRQYDHEVQGNTVVKPLVGPSGRGPSDAAVIEPVPGTGRGLAISCGLATGVGDPRHGGDPYLMALGAIDECVRNLVCVGASASRIAILDNFCWPGCDRPENMGALVRAAEGCYDGAKAYRTPFVSGKDSLNNQLRYTDPQTGEPRVIEIPPTLLISGIGIVPSIRSCVTMDVKQAGGVLLLIGSNGPEMGGSLFAERMGLRGMDEDARRVPAVDLASGPATAAAVAQLIRDGLVRSAHDCSEGGLLVCVAEMLIASWKGPLPEGGAGVADSAATSVDVGDVIRKLLKPDLGSLLGKGSSPDAARAAVKPDSPGASLTIWDDLLEPEQLAFGERPSRYVVEVRAEDVGRVRTVLRDHGGIPATAVGTVTASGRLTWARGDLDIGVGDLARAWIAPLDW
ncbi:MAG: phosphoribosylformylglycinamidine synthase [Phycisphaerae bacterium]|nr:phosphoribosylformylglycinamidine synthase [Phycisphaerae bacterium]